MKGAPVTDIHLSYDVPADVPGAFAGFVDDFALWWPRTEGTYGAAGVIRRLNGVLEIPSANGTEVLGYITEWEPPERLTWHQGWRHRDGVTTHVSVTCTESEWGTRVRLTHSGWADAGEIEKEKFADWPVILWHYVAHMRAIAPHEDAA